MCSICTHLIACTFISHKMPNVSHSGDSLRYFKINQETKSTHSCEDIHYYID